MDKFDVELTKWNWVQLESDIELASHNHLLWRAKRYVNTELKNECVNTGISGYVYDWGEGDDTGEGENNSWYNPA